MKTSGAKQGSETAQRDRDANWAPETGHAKEGTQKGARPKPDPSAEPLALIQDQALFSAAWAAASRAIGTRNGEQET